MIRHFNPSRKKDIQEAVKPGNGTLDMRRISPGDSLSKITGNAEPLFGTDQNISRFDFLYFAAARP